MNMLDYEGENDPDFDPEKADRNKDGKISDWERSVGNAVAKSMREQREKKSAEEVISEYDIDMYSLMTFMAFQDPTELSVVRQSIDEMGCDRDTVRWAIYWWNSNWGGVPEETLNYLGLSEYFGAEEFESEFSKGDMLNLRKYIDYPLDWINENFIPKDTKKARKSDQRMRGQIPTKRSSDDFRQGIRTTTPLWFKAIQGAIIAVAVGAISFKGMSELEEPEEPEREKEE